MKVILEYTVDESIFGPVKDLQKMSDWDKVEVFLEDPLELIHGAVWRFEN